MNKILIVFLTAFTVFLITGCKATKKEDFSFYVGTYTNKDSKGIYKYEVSSEGRLKKIGLVAETINPTFLAKSKDNKTLFAVSEVNENGTGFVKSFKIEKDTLKLISKENSGGADPCFVAINNENYILTANYGGGSVGLLKADTSGKLSSLLNVQQHVGKGTTDRQKSPHAHSVWFHPASKEIISVDLGTNLLWFSTIDKEKNELVLTPQKTLEMAIGAGPRHLTFHPNNKWIYVLNELNNTVSLIKEKDENYFVESSISTIPKGFTDKNYAADIHISKDGKFLYASNRGHNSIVIYSVNLKNGSLRTLGFQSVLGKNPRNFSLSPNGAFLLVANQDSDNIISFKRNSVTGKLSFVSEISASMPVCILF